MDVELRDETEETQQSTQSTFEATGLSESPGNEASHDGFFKPLASSTPETIRPSRSASGSSSMRPTYTTRRTMSYHGMYPTIRPDYLGPVSTRGFPGHYPSPSVNQSTTVHSIPQPEEATHHSEHQEAFSANVNDPQGQASHHDPYPFITSPIAGEGNLPEDLENTRSSHRAFMASTSDRNSDTSAFQRDMAFLCQRLGRTGYRWFIEYQQMDRARMMGKMKHLNWHRLYDFLLEDKIEQREQLGLPGDIDKSMNESMVSESIVKWLLNNERAMEEEFDMLKHWDDRMAWNMCQTSRTSGSAQQSPPRSQTAPPPRPPKVTLSPPAQGASMAGTSLPQRSHSEHLPHTNAMEAPSAPIQQPVPSSPSKNRSPIGYLADIPSMPDKVVQDIRGTQRLRNRSSVMNELYNSFVTAQNNMSSSSNEVPEPAFGQREAQGPPVRLDNKPNRTSTSLPQRGTPPPAYPNRRDTTASAYRVRTRVTEGRGGVGSGPESSDSSESGSDGEGRKPRRKRRSRRQSNSSSGAEEAEAVRQKYFREAFEHQDREARVILPTSASPGMGAPFKLKSSDVSTFDPADKTFRVTSFIAELRNLKMKYGEASVMDLFAKQLRGEARALYNSATREEWLTLQTWRGAKRWLKDSFLPDPTEAAAENDRKYWSFASPESLRVWYADKVALCREAEMVSDRQIAAHILNHLPPAFGTVMTASESSFTTLGAFRKELFDKEPRLKKEAIEQAQRINSAVRRAEGQKNGGKTSSRPYSNTNAHMHSASTSMGPPTTTTAGRKPFRRPRAERPSMQNGRPCRFKS
ncbi:hypothetical protein YB2330_000642 [Saitoella coloradoensis]